ncbi:MAG: FkbM family methyltransferase [Saprospiraceae bacterium]|jgi:FkbM family methyltransferase|nr:FkbM family methyltransferase [Saprospiraceae bacterium]
MQLLVERLAKIERLARGSIFDRLLSDPLRYVAAIGFWRFIYPMTKKGKFAQARTFFGADMEVILPSATEIYLFGAKTHDSEIRLARFLMKNLKSGDTFCDVGAHFGYFSLLASQIVGTGGRVISFEASKSTFGILQKNTHAHPNVTPVHRAASDEDKTLVFNEFPPLYSEYNSLVPEADAAWMKGNPARPIEVQGVRLSDFFETNKLKPGHIKIDVEGAEPQVLAGLRGHLEVDSPVIIMEYLISSGQSEAHRVAAGFLQKAGYQSFTIKNDGSLGACPDIEMAMKEIGLDSDNIVFRR